MYWPHMIFLNTASSHLVCHKTNLKDDYKEARKKIYHDIANIKFLTVWISTFVLK